MQKEKEHHDKILDIVVQKDEVTWQNMIYELVKHENMNPWDIDVSRLTGRYLEMLKKLKELDFRVSGKIVLAASILLKIKSQKLLSDDIGELDRLMSPEEELSEEEFYDDLEKTMHEREEETPSLIPRTPQPRKRKVSIYDLMIALQKALEVRDRRVLRSIPSVKVEVPERKVDITKLISDVYSKIKNHFSAATEKLTFSKLTQGIDKETKIHSFSALLHLANVDHRNVDLLQEDHFGEIEIVKPVAKPVQPQSNQ
ncbi:hypothetical protein CMO88_04825 [Candidatus Woesearchaeota archaeon]|nr:hypothetical protein [Candidatus Woesearchaeota archaeon]|tara:strand:- start:3833 stop:4600 length:768 start_codon:yes stop_codon:yes gene_type:complete